MESIFTFISTYPFIFNVHDVKYCVLDRWIARKYDFGLPGYNFASKCNTEINQLIIVVLL